MRRYFYRQLQRYLDLYIRPDDRVLEIDAKASPAPLQFAQHFLFAQRDGEVEPVSFAAVTEFKPDYVLLNGNIHYEKDIQGFLENLHGVLQPSVRIIIIFYSTLWKPVLRLATALGLRGETPEENWIAHEDMRNLLLLAGYELVREESKLLLPVYIPLVSYLVNRFLAPLPGFRLFTLVNIDVARPLGPAPADRTSAPSVSVIVPARNESGNIESAILRTPQMGLNDELIFIEGNSTDDTWETIRAMQSKYGATAQHSDRPPGGKRKRRRGAERFRPGGKDILMILDADLTVAP